VQERLKTLKHLEMAALYNREEFERLMGYPPELPDLTKLKPPHGNYRQEGIWHSFHSRRMRGEALGTF
jgi:hypothetical protein